MLQHSKKCRIFATENIFLAMKLLKLIIIMTVFLVACGERPLPNQDLLSAYEFLKKGEIDTAKVIRKSRTPYHCRQRNVFDCARSVCRNNNGHRFY